MDDVSWMFVVFGCRDTVFGSFHSIDVSTVHSRSNKRETILLNLSHLFFDCSTFFLNSNPAVLPKSYSPVKEVNKKIKSVLLFQEFKRQQSQNTLQPDSVSCWCSSHFLNWNQKRGLL